jgi:general secretion pathway protein C
LRRPIILVGITALAAIATGGVVGYVVAQSKTDSSTRSDEDRSKRSDDDEPSDQPHRDASTKFAPLEGRIHDRGAGQFEADRGAFNDIIKNLAQLAAGLRARQTSNGVRLSGIKSSSIMTTIGLKNGDILKSINGYDMSDQDKALEAYARLKTAKSLLIEIERAGSPISIVVELTDKAVSQP